MTDDTRFRTARTKRRKFIKGVGTGVAAGIAGSGPVGAETAEQPEERSERAQRNIPTEGMDTAPNILNPLASSTAYSFEILERVYSFGTTLHPETQEFTGWAFRDWELNSDNVGSGDPTIVGELRDDMKWHDGEDVTAEDVQFTVNYVQEQEPAGTVSASQFSAVEEVQVDSPDGTTVNYFLSEKDSAWFTDILGNIILPKHIWQNVDQYDQYTPRNTDEGLVGSGPMVLDDFSWENWFSLRFRDDTEAIWQPNAEYVDWIDSEAPFTDGWRIEVFGSQTALQQAVLDGNVDCAYGTFQVDKAVEAKNNDNVRVIQSEDDGWSHQSWNLRRVPFDDPAFRQFLVMMMDTQWVIEDLKRGVGSVAGTYATPKAYEDWRPPEPSEQEEYEGIPTPSLEFPGERGSFNLNQEGIDAARNFLVNHDRAKHDYSWEEANAPEVAPPDGLVLHVNGDPLHQAHTDNDGNPGQGPLEMSFNPPQEDLDEARIAQRWIGALKTVGVPVEPAIQSFNSQIPKVYGNENFDMFGMGWTGIDYANDHYKQLYGSWGADVDSTEDAQVFNAMGYTGADDLIEQQATMMELEPRKPIVKKVLARIWADAPTDVVHHANVLQPVNRQWEGWVQQVGGVVNPYSSLNLRPAQN